MSLQLFAHNQEAFDAALDMLSLTGKAAVVHPTGTGKSYIGFKLCEQLSDKKFCWLSPSRYIFDTQMENIKRDSNGWQPENITFFTYAKLMLMTDDELSGNEFDYIILDEFHRCGAEMWGDGLKRLLSLFPAAKLLGLSATAVRYLDNQRNMADELFDGCIASEMTLGEAIVRGILKPPKYVLSVFSYQEDFIELRRCAQSQRSKLDCAQAEKYLEALRRALEKADGMDVIFDKHMENRTGKYIVFCSNIEHLREMQGRAKEWFGKVDANPHIYTTYSDDPSMSEDFEAFKHDDSEHLKLLYAIDMLNEGIHVDDISGVILCRPTVSPTVYKQQIGRALATGKNGTPLIFDVVNNIENLYSIGTVQEEIQNAVTYYRSFGRENEIVNDGFDVIDEVQDAKQLFDKLNDALTASWDDMYRCAEQYYRMHGSLDVPRSYKTPDGYLLGRWIMTQRDVYAGKRNYALSEQRVKKLEAIGMIWDNRFDIAWERNYAAAKAYYEKHGDLKIPPKYVTEDGIKLGNWICNMRSNRKNSIRTYSVTPERIQKLDDIGMIWDGLDYIWNQSFSAAEQYYLKHVNLDVPVKYVDENNFHLYDWLAAMKTQYRQSKLSSEKIALLSGIGMEWRTQSEINWNDAYESAKKYREEHGDLNIPYHYKTTDGFLLGRWLHKQRQNYHSEQLDQRCIERLNQLGVSWELPKKAAYKSWDSIFQLAKRYYLEHGNLNMPVNYQIDGVNVARWLVKQKRIHNKNKTGEAGLTAEQIEKLNSIGFDWDSKEERLWKIQYSEAESYYSKNGDLNIPESYISPSGKRQKNG